jgi:hypothetical protein
MLESYFPVLMLTRLIFSGINFCSGHHNLVLVGKRAQWIMIEYSTGRLVEIQKLEFYRCKIDEHYFMSLSRNHIVNDSYPNVDTIYNYYTIMFVTQCGHLMTLNQ